MADRILRKVRGMAVEAELVVAKVASEVAVIVVVAKETEEEAWNGPLTWKGAATVEEAEEINPPTWVARPATDRVEEAETGPETLS